jgi:hypothetical protein
MPMTSEQAEVWALREQGMTNPQIAEELGLTLGTVKNRIQRARKWAKLDPTVQQRLIAKGYQHADSLHSGWILDKDDSGSGESLYFYLGKNEDTLSVEDLTNAIRDELASVLPAPTIPRPEHAAKNRANFIGAADFHLGGAYGDPKEEEIYLTAIDDLIARLPLAHKAVFIDLGDLTDANDHTGTTPKSKNPLDVRRDELLPTIQLAVRILKYAAYKLAETHHEVELHFKRGNHDMTIYMGIMVALHEHFSANPESRVKVIMDDREFYPILWGGCGILPNHGDQVKWETIKDIWAEDFPDEWAKSKVWREIWTGHMHHLKSRELIGAYCRQFGTIAAPSAHARDRYRSRGTLTAVTFDKKLGRTSETVANVVR